MLNKRVKKYIVNPCLGLIPFLVYFITFEITEKLAFSLILAICAACFSEVFLKLYTKTSRIGSTFLISFVSLVLTLIFWLVFNKTIINYQGYLILSEIILVVILMVIRLSRVYLTLRFFRKDDLLLKSFVNEFFSIVAFIQYFFTLHIFSVVLYEFLKDNGIFINNGDSVMYIWIPIVGVIMLILYENIKLSQVLKKLRTEEWIPIVDEQGGVKGKIAKSVSLQMKNKFMHPIVRVALVCKGKLYLQYRKSNDILDPQLFDHPFEKYMLFNHEINLAVRNSIVQILGKELAFKFVIKYTFENEDTKRLIFLFVTHVDNESDIENIDSLHGKFWSTKQIEANFGDISKFSECFQLEYEYLKNTVLAIEQMNNTTV